MNFLADNTSVESGMITTDDISIVMTNHSFGKSMLIPLREDRV